MKLKTKKPPASEAAFTLLELIIVVIILGIVGTYVQSKFVGSERFEVDSVSEQLISAARLSQQLAMNDSDKTILLDIQSNQINLLVDGATFSGGAINFPISLSANVTLSPVSSISFNHLGETTATTISVQIDTTLQVCFEASGYIHRC